MPLILDLFLMNVRTSQFQKTTSEISEMVEEYGGVTPELLDEVGELSIGKDKLAIRSEVINGAEGEPGSVVSVTYTYEFDSFTGYAGVGLNNLTTTDEIVIKKR